jgi:hypothetical protein
MPNGDTVRGVWAHFQPQAWSDDYAIEIDGAFMFDVTIQIEKMGREKALEIEDCSDLSDELWRAWVGHRPDKDHRGPYAIQVKNAIRKFYDLD